MAKPFKLPKTINGIRLPKATRKQANRFLEKLHGEELEALIAAVVTAVIAHIATRRQEGEALLKRKLAGVVGSHLKH
ncbi:hypothetical protein [Novosphingobium cyanobacteriorum]|uniref:Uncharacterized protein n=1 Tax=Novosphingobium cyanobacteriorum TaxID=3024215 RepID=A0ABT6CJA1_9SPHN|nr:hypothetical protein [Novosphingobium cyanobacteriorum]MDF8333988.1 hypothetical protein [Novosphingobium cyanobacteriorum]